MNEDWVREEIRTALRRKASGEDIEILPVLVGSSTMPRENDLDDELAPLSHFQPVMMPASGRSEDYDAIKTQLIRYRFVPKALPPVTTPRAGKLPQVLTAGDEAAFISEFQDWDIVETREADAPGGFRRELHRVYEFGSFQPALKFMNEVAVRGIEPHNHHPSGKTHTIESSYGSPLSILVTSLLKRMSGWPVSVNKYGANSRYV